MSDFTLYRLLRSLARQDTRLGFLTTAHLLNLQAEHVARRIGGR